LGEEYKSLLWVCYFYLCVQCSLQVLSSVKTKFLTVNGKYT